MSACPSVDSGGNMAEDNVVDILVDRIRQCSVKPGDNVEAIRTVTAKIRSRTSSQDKNIKLRTLERIWNKQTGILPLLLSMLEGVRDHIASCSLAGILRDCVSPRQGKVRSPAVRVLIALNATNSMVKLVKQQMLQEGGHADEQLLQELIWILAQLSQRDPKFAVKTRLLGAVKTFHILLRTHYNNTRIVFPILLVIKSLSRNASTTTVLVKDGIVATMEKTLVCVGFSPNPKLRLAMNVLNHLTKNRLCCTRIGKTGILHLILRIFERWDRFDGKVRLRICNYTLATLQHLCSSKAARKSLRALNGLQLLYKFSTTCPDHQSYDSLLSRVCAVINICLERRKLPIDVPTSPATFPLPAVSEYFNGELPRSGSSSRETTPGSDDDDEDYPEDDEEEGVAQDLEDGEDKGQFYAATIPIQRDIDDLQQYKRYFQELSKTNEYSRNSSKFSSNFGENGYINDIFVKTDFNSTKDSNSMHKFNFYNKIVNSPNSTASMVASLSENSLQQKDMERKLSDEPPQIVSSMSEPLQIKRCVYSSENMISGLTTLANIPRHCGDRQVYSVVASRINSVLPFVKVAYPDIVGSDGSGKLEPLNVKDRRTCRSKLLTCVERGLHPGQLINKIVYDLDVLSQLQQQQAAENTGDRTPKQLFNMDEQRLGKKDPMKPHLTFESRFESGNLRKAIQIGPREYELILMPDVNSAKHHQWFYFEVGNMEADVPYIFNIVNCEKQNSQFNFGMKPIMYSVREAVLGRPGWLRTGTDICYFRNSYQNLTSTGKTRSYLTTTFTVNFPHAYDVCYFAYHYPYTYSQLLTQIWKWSSMVCPPTTYFRAESLCLSLNNNETPLLTITAPESETNTLQSRETVFLTSRVHPGESNASWVMLGTLSFLLSESPVAMRLLRTYIFKVVPMLNMEGVINGCHRCGLTDEDLNRRWSRPNEILHPVIYHTKGLLDYCVRVLKKPPVVFCDYHGHSRRKNVFLYGCSNGDSWNQADKAQPDVSSEYLLLPQLMQRFSPAFALPLCNFKVERGRESTARVTVWREFGIRRSYTMESSYCGCDQGLYQGNHLDTIHLKEMGATFCEALSYLNQGCIGQQLASFELPMYPGKKRKPEFEQDDSGSLDLSDSSDDEEEYHCILD